MWVRKSEEEIQDYLNQQEAKRKSLLRPFLFSLIISVIGTTVYSLGYRGGSLSSGIYFFTNPSGFNIRAILIGIFLFVFLFALALYRQRRGKSFWASDHFLCRECTEPASANSSMTCQCGGTLEPFAFFNWTEDAERTEEAR